MTLVGDQRRSLTAASVQARVTAGQVQAPKELLVDNATLWSYYETLGDVHNAMTFKRNAVTRARFLPARLTGAGMDPEPVEDGPVAEAFAELDAGRGRVAELVADLVVHLDVAGIGWVHWSPGDDARGSLLEARSTEEVKREGSRRLIRDAENFRPPSPDDLLVAVWRPSPRRRRQPDSSLRAIAAECEELLVLSRLVRASAWSRQAAGLLKVPTEIDLPPPTAAAATPKASFIEDLKVALTTPIADPGSVAAVVPYVAFGPAEALKALERVDLARTTTREEIDLRRELRERIAAGLDLPPEVLTGMGGLNHWSGWLVDANAYRQHVDPPVLLILDELTDNLWHPFLRQRGIAGWDQYVLWRDIGALTASPNRFADAILAFDRGIITADAVRRIGGYDDTDAPATTAAAPSGVPAGESEPPTPRGPARTPPPQETSLRQSFPVGPYRDFDECVRRNRDKDDPEAYCAALERRARKSLTAATDRVTGRRLTAIDRGLQARLLASADAALHRTLERAGARARNRTRTREDLSAALEGVPNHLVVSRLGPSRIAQLQMSESELIGDDAWDAFSDDAARRLMDAQDAAAEEALRLGGAVRRNPTEEAEWVQAAVALMVAALAAAASRALYTPDLGPDPVEAGEVGEGSLDGRTVLDAMTLAGGGGPASVRAGAYDVGVGNGPAVATWLRDGGTVTTGYRWDYGPVNARRRNFLPHLELDGLEFDDWDDPGLAVHVPFPGGGVYRPGDHRGCLCWYERLLEHEPAPQTDLEALNARRLASIGGPRVRPGIDDDPGIIRAAQARYREALEREREISAILDPVARRTGAQFVHYEERVKFEKSIRDKIYRARLLDPSLTPAQAAERIIDTNRYTLTWANDDLWRARQIETVESMRAAGWQLPDGADSNYWGPGDAYDGMNYKFRRGASTVEIQFHTPASAAIQERSHVLYERARLMGPGPEQDALLMQMKALWADRSHVPPNVLDLGTVRMSDV